MKDEEFELWAEIVGRGTTKAMMDLSRLIDQKIEVSSFALKQLPVADISKAMGGPEVASIGIYLTVSGSADGHILLIYEPKMAHGFADVLLGQHAGTTDSLDAMAESALGEMGNIVGSSFLNVLANSAGLSLLSSPPIVKLDMTGSLLDVLASDILLTQDDAFVAETSFQAPDREITGVFFVIPTPDLLRALVEGKRAA